MTTRRLTSAILFVSLLSAPLQAGIAQTRPSDIEWSGTAGEQRIQIPAGEKPTVMLFIRAEQSQSDEALEQLSKLLVPSAVQAIIVYSGPQSPQQVQKLTATAKLPCPVLADADYALSGKMGVHAWPTTVMISGKGDVMGHIAGITKGYGQEFTAYLDFLTGKIDRTALDAKLSDRSVVADNPGQAASRHLQMASRLLAKGRIDDAQTEINTGLNLQPDHPQLKLAQIRVLLLKGNIDEAAKALEFVASLKPGSVPAPQLALAQGRVLAAKGELAPAIEALERAIKLNPEPSEAQYELGLVYQKQEQWEKSATAFRAAYEAQH